MSMRLCGAKLGVLGVRADGNGYDIGGTQSDIVEELIPV